MSVIYAAWYAAVHAARMTSKFTNSECQGIHRLMNIITYKECFLASWMRKMHSRQPNYKREGMYVGTKTCNPVDRGAVKCYYHWEGFLDQVPVSCHKTLRRTCYQPILIYKAEKIELYAHFLKALKTGKKDGGDFWPSNLIDDDEIKFDPVEEFTVIYFIAHLSTGATNMRRYAAKKVCHLLPLR